MGTSLSPGNFPTLFFAAWKEISKFLACAPACKEMSGTTAKGLLQFSSPAHSTKKLKAQPQVLQQLVGAALQQNLGIKRSGRCCECVPRSPGVMSGKRQPSYLWKKSSCSSVGKTFLTCKRASSLCLGKILILVSGLLACRGWVLQANRRKSGHGEPLSFGKELLKEPFNFEPGGVITNSSIHGEQNQDLHRQHKCMVHESCVAWWGGAAMRRHLLFTGSTEVIQAGL